MELVDRAVYFVPADAADAAIRRLQAIDVTARGWRDKISVAWLLEGDSPVVPAVPNLADLASRDFKIHETPPGLPSGRSLANGLERLVHDLRGVRVGVALGGGAARGMSHLGVLKALEQQRHRRRHDRRHQRRRHDRHHVLRRPGSRLQRGCVRRGPSPLLDFSPPAARQLLVPPLQVSPRAIRPDASQVPARLEARTTCRPLSLRHGRPGERQLGRSRTRRCRPCDPREHQLARALRADRPQRPGADRRRAGQQHPGGCAGVDGLQFRDRRQRDGEAGDSFLRHHARETESCPGTGRASCRRSCAACSFRTTT